MSPREDPFTTLTVIFCAFFSAALTSMAATIWPQFLESKFEEYLHAKAKASPAPETPRLNLFTVPYSHQTSSVSPFMISNLESCLGSSSFAHD
jgi:hypothetical protein